MGGFVKKCRERNFIFLFGEDLKNGGFINPLSLSSSFLSPSSSSSSIMLLCRNSSRSPLSPYHKQRKKRQPPPPLPPPHPHRHRHRNTASGLLFHRLKHWRRRSVKLFAALAPSPRLRFTPTSMSFALRIIGNTKP